MDDTYYLNDVCYSKSELLKYATKIIHEDFAPVWEKELYQFISEWFSAKKAINIYTSGSTGSPKKIILQKSDIVKSASRSLSYFGLNPGENVLLCLPVKYIAGMLMVIRAFTGKLNLITISPQQFDIRYIDSQIQFAALVPLQLEKALENPVQLNKIKKIIIGGAMLSANLSEKLISSYTGTAWETYGMTETITHIAIKEVSPHKNDRFITLPGITINTDTRGCLIINDPLIQKQPIVTNDMAELITNTSFKLLGRIDSIINSGGIKIQPEKLEEQLSASITQKFCISSVPDPKLGELIVLVIEKGADHNLLNHAISRIEIYTRPKKIIEVNSIPLKNNGKIDRLAIKKLIKPV